MYKLSTRIAIMIVYLQEMLSHVVVLISGAVEGEVVVVKEVKTLWTAGLLQIGVVQLNVKVEQRLVLNFRLAQRTFDRFVEVQHL